MNDATKELLKRYQKASQISEDRWHRLIREELRSDFHELVATSREAVSRCVLTEKPGVIIAVLSELQILLHITGSPDLADILEQVAGTMTKRMLDGL